MDRISKHPEYSWRYLEDVGEYYHGICRVLRNKFRWSVLDVDNLPLKRVLRIYRETEEDLEETAREDTGSDLDDLD